jgi:hypothetical protein
VTDANAFPTSFPAAFITAIEMLSLCTSMPIYLVLHKGCSFLEGMSQELKTYFKKGRPFIMCGYQKPRFGHLEKPTLIRIDLKS